IRQLLLIMFSWTPWEKQSYDVGVSQRDSLSFRRSSMKRLAAAALVVIFAGAAVAADNPTGTWKWSVMGQGGKARETTLKLKLEGDKLTGSVAGRQGGQDTPIEDATFKDGEVSFKITRERNGQKFSTKYSGKLSGDTIKGKSEFDRNGQAQSRD